MSDLTSTGGIESWLRRAERRMRNLEGKAAKGRIPRLCTSTIRPDPSALQPGVRIFETNTNRSIFVNAAQTGYVDGSGQPI